MNRSVVKVGVCARVKDEDRILEEWVRHYFDLGFTKVVIYDDDSKTPVVNLLSHLVADERLHVEVRPTKNQFEAYSDVMEKYRADVDWMLLCDADEFLWTDGRTVHGFLASFSEDIGTVLLNWLVYGTGGIRKMDPHQSIKSQFTVRERFDSPWNRFVKSFVRTGLPDLKVWVHVTHSAHKKTVDANGQSVAIERVKRTENHRVKVDQMPVLLVHYMTLDETHMAMKCIRNRALCDIGAKYTRMWYKNMFNDDHRDDRMLKYERQKN